MRSTVQTMVLCAAVGATAAWASASVTIQNAQGPSTSARFTGNSFAGGSGPGGNSPSQTPASTSANVTLAGSGGSGTTSSGLGDFSGTTSYGSATTSIQVTASGNEFRVHISGVGDVNAPAGYNGLSIGASLSFFDIAIAVTGAGSIPYTIQKTGDLASVTWTIVPEAGTGASLGAGTLTAGSYRFDESNSSPSVFHTYSFGNGGAGNVHRTFAGDFILTVGAVTGVCCRGATCNTTLTQAQCTASGTAGAVFVPATAACNTSTNNRTPCCYTDYDKSGTLAVADIFAYLNDWFASRPAAVFGGNGTTGSPTVPQIFTFLNAWFAGC